MYIIIFTKEPGYNEVLSVIKNSRKERREVKSFFLSFNRFRKRLTLKQVEKIWNSSLCSEYTKISELPKNYIRRLKRDGLLMRWYEV